MLSTGTSRFRAVSTRQDNLSKLITIVSLTSKLIYLILQLSQITSLSIDMLTTNLSSGILQILQTRSPYKL